ncbi:hypothetical protein KP509_28G069100 [Ceratopteris richardii]|uniref:Phospholipase C n=1 Tax=Ceratopteris richardii TaxID=49495 RepID=A0A8T2RER9_CERRI|nr:hypothetical protein KP509_28G069100 [Ceratopteris richardii]
MKREMQDALRPWRSRFLVTLLILDICFLGWQHQALTVYASTEHGNLNMRKTAAMSGPIRTVVVLVLENRSFDHMLGWMRRLMPELDGVTGSESNPLSLTDAGSPRILFSDGSEFVDPDPGHSFQAMKAQIFGSEPERTAPDGAAVRAPPPPMSGFAAQAESMQQNLSATVMSGFRPEVIPVYAALAQEFAVCDRWFASVPSSTQPNRLYIHSATSYGATSNEASKLTAGYPQRTIFDDLSEAGLSFGIYYQNVPSVLFYRSLRQLKYINRFLPYGLWFKRHARTGSLPNYVVIEPRYFDLPGFHANDDHPSHDVSEGQKLVKEVYETLRSSPQWNQTLLIITYDEHGGFFDHVPTPVNGVPSPDDIVGPPPFNFTFHRLGVRVPTMLISPWINKGTVLHEPVNGPTPSSQFEHSSIPATVRKLFNLPSGFLSNRDAWAASFEHLFYERTTPRTDCAEVLPNSPWSLRHAPPDGNRTTSEFQQELIELAAAVNGPRFLKAESVAIAKQSVRAANAFVESAMTRFIRIGRKAARAGMDAAMLIQAIA